MPTKAKSRPRSLRIKKILDDILVAATWSLILVAISLATLLFVEIQIASWSFGEADQGVPPQLQVTATPL